MKKQAEEKKVRRPKKVRCAWCLIAREFTVPGEYCPKTPFSFKHTHLFERR